MGPESLRVVQTHGIVPVSPNIILYDGFEDWMTWGGSGAGADWVADRADVVGRVMNGRYAMRLITKATAPAVGDWVAVGKGLSFPLNKIVTMRCFWSAPLEPVNGLYIFRINNWTGSIRRWICVRYSAGGGIWQYLNTAGSWVNIPGSSQVFNPSCINFFEMVVNWETGVIISLRLGDLILENINLNTYAPSDTTKRWFMVEFSIVLDAADRQTMYIDDVLVFEGT